jgi:hypothetical protein
MNPPTIHFWPSRLQIIATGFIISGAVNTFWNDYPMYTPIAFSIAFLLTLAAWYLNKRQRRAIAAYLESTRQERQAVLGHLARLRWEERQP